MGTLVPHLPNGESLGDLSAYVPIKLVSWKKVRLVEVVPMVES